VAHLSIFRSRRACADGDPAEHELLRQVAAGDRAALAALYRAYHRRLSRFMAQLTRRADVIEEAINDTFWVVWQKADLFRGDSRVSTWIMGIGYRCALKALRNHGDDPMEWAGDELALQPLEDPFAAHELNDWVAKGMRRLVPEQRLALELAYGAGHSLEEIAAITGCAVSAVKARMFHARVKLRILLPALAGQHAGRAVATDQEIDDEQAR
jgi:RNA polymerase sigma-70 factor (ECF subfamily)